MSAAEAQYGFHAGQQDAEPEWQKVFTCPTNQQAAVNVGRWATTPISEFYNIEGMRQNLFADHSTTAHALARQRCVTVSVSLRPEIRV
jgi:hypothetical protein